MNENDILSWFLTKFGFGWVLAFIAWMMSTGWDGLLRSGEYGRMMWQ